MTPASKPKIHIERMMYRSSVAVMGERAASYALVKLIPSGGGTSVALNLALALDVSGSMYEEDGTGIPRLRRIQDAAKHAIAKLKPTDTISIVAFAHNAQVVLPSTPVSDRAQIEDVIEKIDMFDVDPGGTSMDQGMQLGMDEIRPYGGSGKLTEVVVLTDGETSNEQICRQLAQQAGAEKIRLAVMGVGTEWNSNLIKDLADKAEGKWYYIDVTNAQDAERVFNEEFEQLASTGFTNVQMHLRPMKDITIKRVRQVVPDIREMPTSEPEERHIVASLGTLENQKTTRYILDLSLPKRPDGKFNIATLEVTYDVGAGEETTGAFPLEVSYTSSGQGYVNAEVARHIDEVQIYELNKNLQDAIGTENTDEAKRVAQQIEKKGELMGKRAAKKTMLAKQVLDELHAGGRVSKKTQLAVDDVAREATDDD